MSPPRSMYGPAPVRPTKTGIVRSRNGCKPCRGRRKKCDEHRPSCSRCVDSGTACCYEEAFAFRDANQWAALQVKKVKGDRLDIPSASKPGSDGSSRSPSEFDWPRDTPPSTRSSSVGREVVVSSTPSPCSGPSVFVEQLPTSPFLPSGPPGSASPTSPSPSGSVGLFHHVDAGHTPELWLGLNAYSGEPVIGEPGSHPYQDSAIVRLGSVSPMMDFSSPHIVYHGSSREQSQSLNNNQHDTVLRRPGRRFRVSSSSLSLSLSCSGISSTDHRYLSHFVNHVVDIIPADQSTMLSFIRGSDIALQAAMAIGSANLANVQGRYSRCSQPLGEYQWTSDSGHKIQALSYAGQALSMATRHSTEEIGTLIASHLLLSFVELELGTFDGLRRYLRSVDQLVFENYQKLIGDESGRKMLRSLSSSRAIQRFVAGPAGVDSQESQLDRFWEQLDGQIFWGDHTAQKISYSISSSLGKLCLLTTMRHSLRTADDMAHIVARHLRVFTSSGHLFDDEGRTSPAALDAACDACLAEMKIISGQLKSLPLPDGLPLPDEGSPPCPAAELQPLFFQGHKEAMQTADYVYCRAMCDDSVVRRIIEPPAPGEAPISPEALHWLNVLARIALGLDPEDCVNRNIYRRGICGMLLRSATRCLSAEICGILEHVLDHLILKGCIWEDTTFPSILSVSTVRAVREQLRKGRAILLISTVKDDFNGKYGIMANRMTRTLLMHGWESDGGVFNESLPLDDFETNR